MTFEQWYTENVPEHHRKTIEKNDWIKVWLREAWTAGKGQGIELEQKYREEVKKYLSGEQ